MPTMSTAFTHWKSSANGVLIFIIVTCGVLAGDNILPSKWAGIVALIMALARAYVGIISMDAGTTLAKVPGISAPQAVPSHEIPDDPKSKAVK